MRGAKWLVDGEKSQARVREEGGWERRWRTGGKGDFLFLILYRLFCL